MSSANQGSVALSIAVTLVVSLFARPARACQDHEETQTVLGVGKDGAFLRLKTIPANQNGYPEEELTLHDPDGVEIWSISRELGDSADGEPAWRSFEEPPTRYLGGLNLDPNWSRTRLVSKLAERLRATPLERSTVPLFPSLGAYPSCLVFEAYAPGSGTVVADYRAGFCAGIPHAAELFFHPKSKLWFLHYVDGSLHPTGEVACNAFEDAFLWFPRARLESATTLSLAERAGRRGDSRRAADLARAAVAVDPSNGRAWLGVAEWLGRGGVPWPEVRDVALGDWKPEAGCLPMSGPDEPPDLEAIFGELTPDDDGPRPNAWRAALASSSCSDSF
ncbi:MAG: hypothetical protein U0271_26380 [Polyangiaceae bacterium]